MDGKKRKARKVATEEEDNKEEENLATEAEIDVEEIEKQMGLLHNPDSFAVITLMCRQREEKLFRLCPSLCRMVSLLELRGVQLTDKIRL